MRDEKEGNQPEEGKRAKKLQDDVRNDTRLVAVLVFMGFGGIVTLFGALVSAIVLSGTAVWLMVGGFVWCIGFMGCLGILYVAAEIYQQLETTTIRQQEAYQQQKEKEGANVGPQAPSKEAAMERPAQGVVPLQSPQPQGFQSQEIGAITAASSHPEITKVVNKGSQVADKPVQLIKASSTTADIGNSKGAANVRFDDSLSQLPQKSMGQKAQTGTHQQR